MENSAVIILFRCLCLAMKPTNTQQSAKWMCAFEDLLHIIITYNFHGNDVLFFFFWSQFRLRLRSFKYPLKGRKKSSQMNEQDRYITYIYELTRVVCFDECIWCYRSVYLGTNSFIWIMSSFFGCQRFVMFVIACIKLLTIFLSFLRENRKIHDKLGNFTWHQHYFLRLVGSPKDSVWCRILLSHIPRINGLGAW